MELSVTDTPSCDFLCVLLLQEFFHYAVGAILVFIASIVAAVKSGAVSALVTASVCESWTSTSAAQWRHEWAALMASPVSSAGFAGVWLHGYIPNGCELVDFLQCGLRLTSNRYDNTGDDDEDGKYLDSDLMISGQ